MTRSVLPWISLLLFGCISGCLGPREATAESIHEILRTRPFACDREDRIELCYYRGSEAERQRRSLFEERDRALGRIEGFFGRRAPGPIRILVFPTYDDAAPYPVGTVSPDLRTAYVAFQAGTWSYEKHNPGHELTHVFSNTDAHWRTVYVVSLLDEGLAEYLGGFELDPLPVRRVMGPPGAVFRRVMGPPLSQHEGATGKGGMRLLSQPHGATPDPVFAGSWGHLERAT